MARWLETLAMFEFEIEPRPGERHANADALSRRPDDMVKAPVEVCGIQTTEQQVANNHSYLIDGSDKIGSCCGVFNIPGWSQEEVQKKQLSDPHISPILRAMKKEKKPTKKDIVGFDNATRALWMQ